MSIMCLDQRVELPPRREWLSVVAPGVRNPPRMTVSLLGLTTSMTNLDRGNLDLMCSEKKVNTSRLMLKLLPQRVELLVSL